MPRSEEEWNQITRGFFIRWNFPNCVGAIDGKHINVKCPPGTISDFFNYKSTFSIVLLACVDHDYCFTYIDVGAKGRNSDGGIFNNCTLKKAIEENTINLPSNAVLVGDEAFPLKPYLMKPYPRRNDLSREQKIYNYRLCRCRRIVENAFGVLSSRFRIFEKPITTSVDKVDVIVKTSCALHNWLRKTSPASYTPPGFIDEECQRSGLRLGTWRQNASGGAFENITSQNNRNSTREAIRIRDNYCHYFNNDGAVPWQDSAIF